MKKWIIGALMAVLLCQIAYRIGEDATPAQTVVYGLSDVSYTQMESGNIYKASDLTVVDSYAYSYYGDKTTVEYYLVVFRDGNGRLVAASMPVYASDEIYPKLSYYDSNENARIGECVLDCYVKVVRFYESNGNLDELKGYFAEAVSEYGAVLGETLFPLEWELKYYCSIEENPLSK